MVGVIIWFLTDKIFKIGVILFEDDSNRRKYLYIGISNSPNISGQVDYPVYPVCRQSPDNYPYGNMSISCRPNTPPGRYVVVQQPTTQFGYLTICEIQVHGTKLDDRTQGW